MNISWTSIMAECGNYRQGFVAIFRKYEGQPTDQINARGAVVRVTAKSFAEHLGVPYETFLKWTKNAIETTPDRQRQDQYRAASMVRNQPDAIVEAIMAAPAQTRDRIYDEVKLRRAGIDNSPSAKKASQARTEQILEPLKRALATTEAELCVQALIQAQEHLQEVISAGVMTSAIEQRITAALEAFQFTLVEARYHLS